MSVVANAVLTEIKGPGTLTPNGDPASNGTVLWSGRANGYLKRQKKSAISGHGQAQGSALATGQHVTVNIDVFTILRSAGSPPLAIAGADWEACTVVIEDRRTSPAVTKRFRVNAAENRAAGTIADSVRLELEAESAP